MKVISFFLLLTVLLHARENPFIGVSDTSAKTSASIPDIESVVPKRSIPFAEPKIQEVPKPAKKTIVRHIKKEKAPLPTKIKVVKKPQKKIQKTKLVKKHHKRKGYHTLYKNYFLRIQSDDKHLKILTQDCFCKKITLSNPDRVAIDFVKLQYFKTKSKVLAQHPFVKKIKVGSHHDFYRITLSSKAHTSITKKPYGYLLSFK